MSALFGRFHTTIRLTVVTVFVLATILTVSLASFMQYYFGQTIAKDTAADLYATASSSIAAEVRNVGQVNANVIDLLADNPVLRDASRPRELLEIFARVLEKNPLYYGVYLGDADGGFYEVINLDTTESARQLLRALPTDRWLIMEVERTPQGGLRHYHYLNENLDVRFSRSEPTSFDVTSRPWYRSAMASGKAEFSAPYLFAQSGVPGRTVSRRIPGSDTVVAIDITLAAASRFLREHKIAEHGDVYLYNSNGAILASSLLAPHQKNALPEAALELTTEERRYIAGLGELRVSNEMNWPPIDYAQTGTPSGYSVDILRLIGQMTGLQLKFVNGLDWPTLVEQFRAGQIDLLQSVILTEANADWGLPGASYLHLPYALATADDHAPVLGLQELSGHTLAIPEGWSVAETVRERFPDIRIVPAKSTLHALELVLAGQARAALDNEIVVRYIASKHFSAGLRYHSNVSFGEGPVPDRLHIVVGADRPRLRQILDKAIAAIGDEQHAFLRERWLRFEDVPTTAVQGTVPSLELVEMAADHTRRAQLIETRIDGVDYLAYATPVDSGEDPIYMGILSSREAVFASVLDKVKLASVITTGALLCLLPLSWFFANPIVRPVKQLARENDKVKRREYDRVERVGSHVKELDELSDSMVAMVNAIRAHELAQRRLMDSFIELIAEAIDDKSSYTGGHCERVPELALMLAETASASDHPGFAGFSLETDDQWREYRIAAWLHDCGKITTPEHIVDKGSKLETIYNRIHEVRTRFEVLWRDAEIDYWRQLVDSPERGEDLARELAARQDRLQADFTFVATCNVGGESLDDGSRERLEKIATTTWQRHFDNRIGLSPVEELRLTGDAPPLPATEQLLSDRPEHLIEREKSTDYPPELGIDMDIPELESNLGEVYNLSVGRGTLTTEDRFRINEHMISTIKMLESLPFPEELANVPRYASTHHETMKGSGYPRRLPGSQLSIPERLLAVADVFEALTASDRPYKKAKPVSEAVEILHRMVQDNHIDRDCFDLFIRDGVYLRYARAFLPDEQVDEVDESRYVA